jgi:hypothetical protein
MVAPSPCHRRRGVIPDKTSRRLSRDETVRHACPIACSGTTSAAPAYPRRSLGRLVAGACGLPGTVIAGVFLIAILFELAPRQDEPIGSPLVSGAPEQNAGLNRGSAFDDLVFRRGLQYCEA